MSDFNQPAPPSNIDIERSLLGSLLMGPKRIPDVAEFLRPEHFYEPLHNLIYMTMVSMSAAGKMIDVKTLPAAMQGNPFWDEAGGTAAILKGLLGAIATQLEGSIRGYAEIIVDLAMRRELLEECQEIASQCYGSVSDMSANEILEGHDARLSKITQHTDSSAGLIPFKTVLAKTFTEWERESKGEHGISTGFDELDKILGGLHATDLIFIGGRPSMGKSLSLDADILMSDGRFVKMRDVKVGDRVASVDGGPSVVQGVYPQGHRQLYKITFSDGRHVEADAEHLWEVRSAKWQNGPRVLTTAQIAEKLSRVRYYRRISIDVISGEFGLPTAPPVDPWVLGALIANGGLTQRTPIFTTPDPETLERLKDRLGEKYSYAFDGKFSYCLGYNSERKNPLTVGLRVLGLMGLLSEEKFIPDLYLRADRATRVALLQGLLDTDGWVESFGAVRYGTSSHQLALDVQKLARSLGGICRISKKVGPKYSYKGEKLTGLDAYICNIYHKNREELLLLKRKRDRAEGRRFHPLTFISVEPTRIAEAQCIAVSHPSHLYVTDDFIVTHNTAIATNIAFNVGMFFRSHPSEYKKHQVAFFSLEMSVEQLGSRIVTGQTRVIAPRNRWASEISSREWGDALAMNDRFGDLPFWVDDTSNLSISKLRARCLKLHRRRPLGLVVIDYLQLMSGSATRGKEHEKRYEELSRITRGLKDLAKELKTTIICLSQLSRAVESREDKRPQLADLRETGTIEQDADIVLFPYRAEYYLERAGEVIRNPRESDDAFCARQGQRQAAIDASRNKCEIIVGKQRNGRLGSAMLNFDNSRTWFTDHVPMANSGTVDAPSLWDQIEPMSR